ncbi:bacteriocin immunity protein [Photobacterium galatheae]|uniref:bacteriocin immunity protein n=1 Tax=Photobacterium galatheae TaxID=1654360 RepID=UPI000A46B7E5
MKHFDKDTLSEYTRSDFIELLARICRADASTEAELNKFVDHFEKIAQHPDGSDLIDYPESSADGTPERITEIVQQWRQSQGLPCFKA